MNGRECKSFYLLLRAALFVTTKDMGVHDFTRIFVDDTLCRVDPHRVGNKVGPCIIESVDFDTREGLSVNTNLGVIWTPASDCQVTYQYK